MIRPAKVFVAAPVNNSRKSDIRRSINELEDQVKELQADFDSRKGNLEELRTQMDRLEDEKVRMTKLGECSM